MKTWQKYGLTDSEYQAILDQLGRRPNELELALIGVMWSEHCSYKHTRHLLKTLPTQGPQVVQGPGENAGVIRAGEGLGVAFKIESHNHPSAVEPYHGAATGVGGIVRDVFAMGARPVAVLNSLRFGDLSLERSRWLLKGAVSGIADYGKGLGIPTVGGEVYFDSCYNKNPLVNAMCIGLVPLERLQKGTAAGPGNRVLVVGAKTGRDGIAGAAFASTQLAEGAGQGASMPVGNPALEKLLLEACLELAEHPAVVGVQDLGAAGLTSASCEMAFRGGCGLELELSQVPVREENMTPAELLLSETQERMLVVVRPQGVAEIRGIFAKWGLEAADIGQVTQGKDLVIRLKGQEVGRLPAALLADGVPRRNPPQAPVPPAPVGTAWQQLPEPDYNQTLLTLLASANICSRRPIWRQFDQEAGADTVLQGPGASAAVLRLPGGKQGIAATTDCNSRYCQLDPRQGAIRAVAEAARNLACTGARPAAVTNCLNFPSPEIPEQYWALAQAIEGMGEACRVLDTPVVSGNVSLYNESGGTAIHPTPIIGMVGILEDVERACTIAPGPDQSLVLLGEIQPLPGGSEYLALAGGIPGPVAQVDLELEAKLCRFLPQAIGQGLISAAHDVSEGGVAVTLAEMAMAAGCGLEVAIPGEGRPDFWLFSESPGAVVAAVSPGSIEVLKEMAREYGLPLSQLGRTADTEKLLVRGWIELSLSQLRQAWSQTLVGVLGGE